MKNANLDPLELEIIRDVNFLRSKAEIIDKIVQLFRQLSTNIKTMDMHSRFPYPEGMDLVSGKISKGENYQGLPYVVMDLPRYFNKKHIFTYRSMFWWGHEFSFTLHLSGQFLDQFSDQLQHVQQIAHREDTYFGISQDAWAYDFGPENYRTVNSCDEQTIRRQLERHAFVKISRKLSLNHWLRVPDLGAAALEDYLTLLLSQYEH